MTEINLDEISHLADLARLELSEEEKKQFASELPAIINFVEELRGFKPSADTDNENALKLDALREDVVSENREKLSIEQIKTLAPMFDDKSNQVVVPAVFGEKVDD